MPPRLGRRAVIAATLAAPAILRLRAVSAAEPARLRCSLDTAPTHGRNVAVADFLAKLEKASDGAIKTELFASGSLFNDLDVTKALLQGQVEMALPGTWTLTGLVPDADMFQLPALYGQGIEVIHKVTDGQAGTTLNKEIHDKLHVEVLGPWLDLGTQQWFTTTKVLNSLDDLRGLKIRNSGGAGQAWRARFVGAIPITTAWPNVPLALSQGTFDGLVTSWESQASAQLWESGVKHCLEDRQFFAVYVPLVSDAFWNRLPAKLQMLMTQLWAENSGDYRKAMAQRQDAARETAMKHGVAVVTPTAGATAIARHDMLGQQDQMAKEIKVSPEIVRVVTTEAGVS